MKKKILTITILALAVCLAFAFANQVMAATCTTDTCQGGDKCTAEGECDEKCCPVLIGDKCYPTLSDAVKAAATKDTITLRADVELAQHIGVASKEITIKGNGHTIKPGSNWTHNPSGDDSLITADKTGAKVTLENLTLEDSKKYGAQAFNGGELILNNVTVNNCAYGGILVNGGTVTIQDLKLGHNGGEGTNNGIEVAKTKTEYSDPKIVMDGTIETSQTENVLWIAINDELTKFDVENTENSEDKIYVNGNQLVVTDETGEVLYKSNENDKVTPKATGTGAPTVTYLVEIVYNGNIESKLVTSEGKALADVIDNLDAIKTAVEGSKFVQFLTEDGLVYDETAVITSNLRLTAVYTVEQPSESDGELDESPKAGVNDYTGILGAISSIALLGICVLNKKI